MNPLQKLSEILKPRLVRQGDLVFRIERVDSTQLRRHGYATLEGSTAAQEAIAAAQAKYLREADESAGIPLATIEEREAHNRRLLSERNAAHLMALNRDAAGQVAFLARCDAYLLAAVSGVGTALEEVPSDADAVRPDLEMYDRDTDAAEVAEEIRDCRLVQSRAAHDTDRGAIWIGVLSESQRRELGMVVMAIQNEEAAREVAPFRRGGRGAATP